MRVCRRLGPSTRYDCMWVGGWVTGRHMHTSTVAWRYSWMGWTSSVVWCRVDPKPSQLTPFFLYVVTSTPQCFTSVVGPNGSGKSNVIDAMQFVFAKRAKQLRQNKLSELIHHSDHFPNLPYCKVTVHFQKIRDLVCVPSFPAAGIGFLGFVCCPGPRPFAPPFLGPPLGLVRCRHSPLHTWIVSCLIVCVDVHSQEGDHFEAIEGSEFSISRMAKRDNSSRYEIDGRVAKTSEVVDMLLGLGIDLNSNRFLILQVQKQIAPPSRSFLLVP